MTTPQRNLYGRRRGPKLRDNRATLMRDRMDHYAALSGETGDSLDLAALFPEQRKIWLEVGFGAGEHVAAQAAQNPDVGILACEHYLNGVASCLAHLEKAALTNVRVHNGDARDLMDRLPDGSLERVFVLYPDPWPKARHHKRRFINPENLRVFARIMADGATLRVASDIPDYIDWTLEHLAARDEFVLLGDAESGFREPWSDWPGTRYEAKALREGRTPAYLTFQRKPR
jgi:tRNA (guanine-N7-)-methyltransferase